MKASTKQLDTAPVMLVDDDAAALRSLRKSLERRSKAFEFAETHSAAEALVAAREHRPLVAVVDLSIDPSQGPESGLDLIGRLTELDPTMRIIVLTGHGTPEYGVRALQEGAASFLDKPANVEHLLALLSDGVKYAQLKRTVLRFSEVSDRLTTLTGLTTKSPMMEPVLEAIAFAASNKQPVLLVGETGVGKGVVAQSIHRAGAGVTAPFVRFHPRFGTADLVSSELFGHQKGAFTGANEHRRGLIEDANGGTLFLDEVDELPVETQVQLLHVLQEKTFRRVGSNKEHRSDFRLIAATNQPIAQSLKNKKLRDDFYHRIAHCLIEIPPLRERKEDIPQLANMFVDRLINRERLQVHGLSSEAVSKLLRHHWPGNIRELQSAVEGAVYRAQFHGRRYADATDLLFDAKSNAVPKALSFRKQVDQFELHLVQNALQKAEGNHTKAAALLGLDRKTLRRIVERGD